VNRRDVLRLFAGVPFFMLWTNERTPALVTAKDDIILAIGTVYQKSLAASQNFAGASPDGAVITADLNAADVALQQARALVAAYNFAGQLLISPFPSSFAYSNGQVVHQQFVATGGTTPYRWIWTGNMPTGLTLDQNTGLLSGTVNQPFPGTFYLSIDMTVEDAANDAVSAGVYFVITG